MFEDYNYTIDSEQSGKRLDVCLADLLENVSRSRVQKAIAAGDILLNGKVVQPKALVVDGDIVTGRLTGSVPLAAEPEDIPLDIVFEDSHIAIINKPRGLAVHPGAGRPSGTLVNALAFRYANLPEGSSPERPGIVHRLDMDTSGLIIVALSTEALAKLSEAMAERQISRRYKALVWGRPNFQKAVIDANIGRDPKNPEKMAVLHANAPSRNRTAVTTLTVEERFDSATLVQAELLTGRTHQIRVHCSYAQHPVVGDELYGGKVASFRQLYKAWNQNQIDEISRWNGQALHAYKLQLAHPLTGEYLTFEVDMPPEMNSLVALFRMNSTPIGT